jgi:NAD(P)-dependent dehydrogenase (short-subunit alcohol dehydrogenase family)
MNAATSTDLKDAVVLVTGAGGGIGEALCIALREAGARVIATDLIAASDAANAATWLRHDVTSADDWRRVIEDIQTRFGRLDCLVNNAGVSLVASIAEMSIEQWRRVQSVNVESTLLGLQAALPLLRESGKTRAGGSSVVNFSSVAGLRGAAFNAAYCASKGAVKLLSKSAALEFAALGYPIRVNSIHPGGVETSMMDSIMARYVEVGFAPSMEAAKVSVNAMHPLGRMAQPAEIAAGAVFLCSSQSSFMTGSELVMDGGFTAR